VTLLLTLNQQIQEAGHALRAQLLSPQGKDASWLQNLDEADPRAIIVAIAALGSSGATQSVQDAARDAARSMLELKLTERMIEKMEKLDATTTRLSRAALFVGVVGTVATLISVWPVIRAWVSP
jgi:hypothetical protein